MQKKYYELQLKINPDMEDIIFCDDPIRTDGVSWLKSHVGRVAVGIRLPNGDFDIVAYSDNMDSSAALRKIARERQAIYMVSPDNGGVTTID